MRSCARRATRCRRCRRACPVCALPSPARPLCGALPQRGRRRSRRRWPRAPTRFRSTGWCRLSSTGVGSRWPSRLAMRSQRRRCVLRLAVRAPMPWSPCRSRLARQRERGFNQANEIARAWRAAPGCPLVTGWCGPATRQRRRRCRGRSAPQRARRVRDAQGRSRAGIRDRRRRDDDRRHAGGGRRRAAHAGAARVDAWVVARTLPPAHGGSARCSPSCSCIRRFRRTPAT